jgi:hypothetical protein
LGGFDPHFYFIIWVDTTWLRRNYGISACVVHSLVRALPGVAAAAASF